MTWRRAARTAACVVAAGGAAASPAGAQRRPILDAGPSVTPFLLGTFADSQVIVAPGVVWHHMRNPAGPWTVNLVVVDFTRCRCGLREVRAKDSLVAREKVSDMAARQPDASRVLVAINADFFDVKTGENENNQVVGGEWWKGVRVTDSPYDTFDNPHTQFAIGADGKPRMDRYVFNGSVIRRSWLPGPPEEGSPRAFPLTALNHVPRGTPEAAVLYTPRYGTTPVDTVRKMAEVRLRAVFSRNDSTVYVVAAPPVAAGGNAIAADEVMLSAYGPRASAVSHLHSGDTLAVVLHATTGRERSPATCHVPSAECQPPAFVPRLLVGGWPRILTDGRLSADRAAWDEGTLSSNAEARHPRSAIGFSADSTTVYLATVDGRSEDSGGMTLRDLALFMRDRGAWQALNFDGGGSSTLVVTGRVVNTPSDPAGERAVGNAILVVARP